MTSFRAKTFIFTWKTFIKPFVLDFSTTKKSNKTEKHLPIKGYVMEVKKTEKKTKYILMKKDNNVEAKKVIYYMHGGAYLMGLNKLYKAFSCVLCDLRDDIEVILLDYSLAPEHTYPTQINEAIDVWMELTKTFDCKDIIVGGDSAGGNLSLVLIDKLKKEYNVCPGAGIFFSPWTDMTCSGESFHSKYTNDIMFGGNKGPLTEEKFKETQNSVVYSFIGNAERADPYISPIFADYTTFPKSIFFVGDDEMLLDDTLTVVKKIRENPENQVELEVKEGMFHVYPLVGCFSMTSTKPKRFPLKESKEALDKVKKFILDYYQ